jgi:hypothetical protein
MARWLLALAIAVSCPLAADAAAADDAAAVAATADGATPSSSYRVTVDAP